MVTPRERFDAVLEGRRPDILPRIPIFMRYGNPDAIREGVGRCYVAAGFPYMVCAGCEIPSGTPRENVEALCEPRKP